ncbi:MAG: asparaginase domain-containing protein [Candidatus Saccharimonadales bacterium]
MIILFAQTGGTIDKDYPENDDNHGYNFEIGEPSFLRTLERANPDFSYRTMTITKKDSLDLTDEDRQTIVKAIDEAQEERIVITHGTDTIFQTAKELAQSIKDKTVILTGARLPEKFYDSEADFNIGMAVAGAQVLPPGIYIALYGLVTAWDKFSTK